MANVEAVYQIKVTLLDLKPKVWRRIWVAPDMKLSDFHHVLQIAMGWQDHHAYLFSDGQNRYGNCDASWEFGSTLDESDVSVADLFQGRVKTCIYEYDFGDNWEHELYLEKRIKRVVNSTVPRCLKGKGACPPENCGGVWGYERLLEISSDTKHEEFTWATKVLGRGFDARYFDANQVNSDLAGAKDNKVSAVV